MALYKWSIRLAGIGSFPDQIQYMSQDDYNALSEEAKMNGTTYGIVGNAEPDVQGLDLEYIETRNIAIASANDQKEITLDYNAFIIWTLSNYVFVAQRNAPNYTRDAIAYWQYFWWFTTFLPSWVKLIFRDSNWAGSAKIYIYKFNIPGN